jgi:hypothetical protein
MNDWFEYARLAAYFLWEHTGCDNALELWYCAEDIACFFEQANILETSMVEGIIKLSASSEGYIWFLRHMAFRLYLYTGNDHELTNWFLAEQLLTNLGWVQNVTAMAAMLRENMTDNVVVAFDAMEHLRSDTVKSFYSYR